MTDNKKENTSYIVKSKLLILLLGIFAFFVLLRFPVSSETAAPEASQTPAISDSTPTIEVSPATEVPTETISASSTPTEPATPVPAESPTPPPPETIVPTPTEAVTPTEFLSPSSSPTPTPELHFLYDFTAPPRNQGSQSDKTVKPDYTASSTMSSASIGIVQVENINNTERGFRWSDLIKYAEYICYIFAGLTIIYGIVCLIGLLAFKKDISIGAIRKRKKTRHKVEKR